MRQFIICSFNIHSYINFPSTPRSFSCSLPTQFFFSVALFYACVLYLFAHISLSPHIQWRAHCKRGVHNLEMRQLESQQFWTDTAANFASYLNFLSIAAGNSHVARDSVARSLLRALRSCSDNYGFYNRNKAHTNTHFYFGFALQYLLYTPQVTLVSSCVNLFKYTDVTKWTIKEYWGIHVTCTFGWITSELELKVRIRLKYT